jgi:hypothetical protein
MVTLFDMGQEGGVHFLIMELVEGVDLRTCVASSGPMFPTLAGWLRPQEAGRHGPLRRCKGKSLLVLEGLAFPNGIVLTHDEKTIYLAESKKESGPSTRGPRWNHELSLWAYLDSSMYRMSPVKRSSSTTSAGCAIPSLGLPFSGGCNFQ